MRILGPALLWLGAAIPVTAACGFDAALPQGVQLQCAATADCPEGLVCVDAIRRCVPAQALATPAATVTAARVEPEVVRAGVDFTLTLDVSAPLDRAPDVVVALAAEQLPLTAASVTTGLTFTGTGTPDDGAWPIVVTLVDKVGHVVTSAVATVRFDSTPPHVLDGSIGTRIDAPPASVRRDVARAAPGATVSYNFLVDEPFATAPTVTVVGGSDASPSSNAGGTTVFGSVVVTSTFPEGALVLHVHGEDAAGNVLDEDVDSGVEVDLTPPADLAIDSDPDLLVYRRIPWGDVDDSNPRFFIEAAPPGTGEPGAIIAMWDSGGALIGQVAVGDDGAIPQIPLIRADRTSVFASQVDAAGIEGSRVRLRNIAWTASLGGKIAGSPLENPHRAVVLPDLGGFTDTGDGEPFNEAALGAAGDNDVVTAKHAAVWRKLTNGPVQLGTNATFDPGVGSVVSHFDLFGLATFDGLSVQTPNTARVGGLFFFPVDEVVAFDGNLQAAVGFAGVNCGGNLCLSSGNGDTWLRTGTAFARQEVRPPPARRSTALAFDVGTNHTVLFGGDDGTTVFDDTWLFDIAGWVEAQPAHRPPARTDAAMVWDRAHQQALLFGGTAALPDAATRASLNDTWAFDGSDWHEITPTQRPPGVQAGGLAYDEDRGVTVLMGGVTDSVFPATPNTEVWSFDGAEWTRELTSALTPGVGAAAWDDVLHLVVFEGAAGTILEYDGVALRDVTPVEMAALPLPVTFERGGAIFTVDTQNNLWRLDMPKWAQTPVTVADDIASGTVFTDVDRNRSTVFVTPLGTRVFTGVGAPGAPINPSPLNARVTYDPVLHRGVAFDDQLQTWLWDGAWHALSVVGPPSPGVMSFDPHTGLDVLVRAKDTGAIETWTFDGTAWLPTLGDLPGVPVLGVDSVGQRLIALVGDIGAPLGSMWQWNGDKWDQIPVDGRGPPAGASLITDPTRGTLVAIGGLRCLADACGLVNDTWEWRGAGPVQSAVRFEVIAGDAFIDGAVSAIVIRALAGGDAIVGGAPTHGAALLGVNHRRRPGWSTLAVNAASPTTPQLLTASSIDIADAQAFIAGRTRLNVAVASLPGEDGPNVNVTVDAIDVTIRYTAAPTP